MDIKDIEEFNLVLDNEIQRLVTMRKELELQLSEILILNKNLVDTEEFFSEIDEQLRELKSHKRYIESKEARV